MKKAIAMRCTQEQFEGIKPKLEKAGYKDKTYAWGLDSYNYLCINSVKKDELGNYSRTGLDKDREVHEQWNEKVFLETCGIEVIPTLEEVREYFKDAEKIESKYTGLVAINNNEFRYNENNNYYYLNLSIELWSLEKGYAKIISYKKPKYEITEEQILELHNIGYTGKEELLEKWFPEAFKKELEAGKWYKSTIKGDNIMFFPLEIKNKNEIKAYGFDRKGIFSESNNKFELGCHDEWKEATPKEVTEALTKEAVRRGLVKGAYCNHEEPTGDQHKPIKDYFYHEGDNCLYGNIENEGGANIFKKGQWAQVTPTKTKEEAEKLLKELGYEFKIV